MNVDGKLLHSTIMFSVTENDLSVDGIHLQESGKRFIVNNLINNFNQFLESANLRRWYL